MVRTPFLWLCGPSGVGKSTVGWEVFVRVRHGGVRAAYVDLAQIGFCRPAPRDDPDNHRMKARNLGALWPTFRAAGARYLIVSGVVHDRATVAEYAAAVQDTALTLCRLRADRSHLSARILLRGNGNGPAIPGDELRGLPPEALHRHADAAVRDGETLDRTAIGDVCVDTNDRSIREIADAVLTAWSPHTRLA
jgi:hypothetical protein